jgi:hypothetical protein
VWRIATHRVHQWISRIARQHVAIWAIAFATLSIVFNISYAVVHGIPQPRIHDEYSYLLAADTFALGRVTNPTPPFWPHFEVPNVLMHPTYQSKYPPAQGISLAIGEVIAHRPIVGIWLCQALATAAIYWAFLAFVSEPWALLGGAIAALHPTFLYWSQDYWGGTVAVLGGALVLATAGRIMQGKVRPMLAVGLAVGLAILANSRPFEGLMFSIPVLIAVVWKVIRSQHIAAQGLALILPVAAIMLPVTAAMGYYNYRVTGHVLRVPYEEFSSQYGVYPKIWLQATLPQPVYRNLTMFKVYAKFEEGDYYKPRNKYGHVSLIPLAKLAGLRVGKLVLMHTDPYLLVVPLGFVLILFRRDRRLWWVLAAISMTFAGLVVETFFLIHYAAPASAAMLLLVILGWREMSRWKKWGSALSCGAVAGVVTTAAIAFARPIIIEGHGPPRSSVVAHLPQLHTGRHLIFLVYDPGRSMNDEWAYNTADIADQPIIWARSITPGEDAKLTNQFPGRQIWKMSLGQKNGDYRVERYSP